MVDKPLELLEDGVDIEGRLILQYANNDAPLLPNYGMMWFSKENFPTPFWRNSLFGCHQPPEIDAAIAEHGADALEVLSRPETDSDTLFFAFYYMPASGVQAIAAAALFDRGWRWHTERQFWMRPIAAASTAGEYVSSGLWETFNPESWSVEKLEGFTALLESFAPRPPVALAGQAALVVHG